MKEIEIQYVELDWLKGLMWSVMLFYSNINIVYDLNDLARLIDLNVFIKVSREFDILEFEIII